MSVDVEIYMNNVVKFFKDNPKDLLNLIPKEKEKEFYLKIREIASTNYEDGKEVSLTQKQLLEICRELNSSKTKKPEIPAGFIESKFGLICLN